MASSPSDASECLKRDAGRTVHLVRSPGAPARLRKTWPLNPWMLLKVLFGIAQSQRQVRGAKRIRAAGVRTPDVTQGTRLHLRPLCVSIELNFAEGTSALDLLKAGVSIERQRMLGRAIGAIVPTLANARLFNRDLKLSNIIVDESDIVWMIDPVGVRLQRDRVEEITRMVHRLASEPVNLNVAMLRAGVLAVLRSALRPLAASERREVLRRLREHRPH